MEALASVMNIRAASSGVIRPNKTSFVYRVRMFSMALAMPPTLALALSAYSGHIVKPDQTILSGIRERKRVPVST
ncbi:hypothetical protein [Nonomuraea turcica]|uniref:hypothetical protein n=1 Tax=Nonomuraea sp. G32 TaxID=3067274 RepID=UPI00273AB8EF|nr:hypothetical protein [Nonomuraea sp. G32]MDP4511023.1 hypothetical protein [Nonomuraea sp. G32]